MIFQHPRLLWLLLVPALLLLLRSRRKPAAIPFPDAQALGAIPKSARTRVARLLPWLQALALVLLLLALARPLAVDTLTTITARGVDIALAIDLSSSMLAVDRGVADPGKTRLAVAKEVVGEFVARRPGDRIAVVAFGARAYPVAPLTLDHDWLAGAVAQLDTGSVEDGTALGDGLLSAIDRLRASPAKSRTVVLVTDGRSNAGDRNPRAAASVAAALGIRVHVIGIGGTAGTLFPVADPLGGVSWREVRAELDEATLGEIAATTGGRYFRADGGDALRAVFLEIDRLEKGPLEEQRRREARELFPALLLPALVLMLLERTLRSGGFGSLP